MRKTFDCIEMKRKVQKKNYKETHNLSQKQELEYFHKAAEQFWKEIESLRKEPLKNKIYKKKKRCRSISSYQ